MFANKASSERVYFYQFTTHDVTVLDDNDPEDNE
jgi:hypothetical protein